MKKLALAIAVLAFTSTPALPNPVTTYPGGIDVAHTFCLNATLTNSAHTVSFGTTSSGGAIVLGTVSVLNLSTTAGTFLYVQTNGTAASGSSAEIQLDAGDSYTYAGTPLHSISVYTAGTSVPYTVGAN